MDVNGVKFFVALKELLPKWRQRQRSSSQEQEGNLGNPHKWIHLHLQSRLEPMTTLSPLPLPASIATPASTLDLLPCQLLVATLLVTTPSETLDLILRHLLPILLVAALSIKSFVGPWRLLNSMLLVKFLLLREPLGLEPMTPLSPLSLPASVATPASTLDLLPYQLLVAALLVATPSKTLDLILHHLPILLVAALSVKSFVGPWQLLNSMLLVKFLLRESLGLEPMTPLSPLPLPASVATPASTLDLLPYQLLVAALLVAALLVAALLVAAPFETLDLILHHLLPVLVTALSVKSFVSPWRLLNSMLLMKFLLLREPLDLEPMTPLSPLPLPASVATPTSTLDLLPY